MKRAAWIRVAAAAVSLVLALPAGAAETSVRMKVGDNGYFFTPDYRVIVVGDTVTWRNTSDTGHTVTTFPGAPESFTSTDSASCNDGNPLTQEDCIQPGKTYSHTFTKPGTYNYYCKPHGDPSKEPEPSAPDDEQPCAMCGTIAVHAAQTRSTTKATTTPPPVSPTGTRTTTTAKATTTPTPKGSKSLTPTPGSTTTGPAGPLAGPDEGGGGGARGALALIAILALGAAGYATWRKYIARP